MKKPFKYLRYRKPPDICQYNEKLEHISSAKEIAQFIAQSKNEIEERISRLGLRLRLARQEDINGIMDLHRRSYPPDTISLEDPYVLHRITSYGYAPLVVGPDGRILGTNICVGYDDADKTAYGVRITVDRSLAGNNIGAELVNYSCLIGMERGSRTRRGLLGPGNYGSSSNFLNHVGYLCEKFYPDLPGFGPRFVVALPLTPGGAKNNRIDFEKLRSYVESHEEKKDYIFLETKDLDAIEHVYENTEFRIVAFCKQGVVSKENLFLALPKDVLGFP